MNIEVPHQERALRADAQRNRVKILDAAALVFASRGLNATLDDVADAAGVGVATVYRRFPDKDALIGALFDNAIDEIASLASIAPSRGDSWQALVWFLDEALQRQCANRGLREVVVGSSYGVERIEAAKCRIAPAIASLVRRAQDDGFLRDDIVEADILVMEMMISFIGNLTATVAPNVWRRYFVIILDGLKVSRSEPSQLLDAPVDRLVVQSLQSPRHLRRGS